MNSNTIPMSTPVSLGNDKLVLSHYAYNLYLLTWKETGLLAAKLRKLDGKWINCENPLHYYDTPLEAFQKEGDNNGIFFDIP